MNGFQENQSGSHCLSDDKFSRLRHRLAKTWAIISHKPNNNNNNNTTTTTTNGAKREWRTENWGEMEKSKHEVTVSEWKNYFRCRQIRVCDAQEAAAIEQIVPPSRVPPPSYPHHFSPLYIFTIPSWWCRWWGLCWRSCIVGVPWLTFVQWTRPYLSGI